MLLFDAFKTGVFNTGIFLGLSLGLAACTVQPLEAPSSGVVASLENVSFAAPETRLDQKLRNALIAHSSGKDAGFEFTASVSKQVQGAAIQRGSGEAGVGKVKLTATYQIVDVKAGSIIAKGTRSATTSYDRSMQEYGNTRAEDDAETRAAKALALRLRPIIAAAVSRAKFTSGS